MRSTASYKERRCAKAWIPPSNLILISCLPARFLKDKFLERMDLSYTLHCGLGRIILAEGAGISDMPVLIPCSPHISQSSALSWMQGRWSDNALCPPGAGVTAQTNWCTNRSSLSASVYALKKKWTAKNEFLRKIPSTFGVLLLLCYLDKQGGQRASTSTWLSTTTLSMPTTGWTSGSPWHQ